MSGDKEPVSDYQGTGQPNTLESGPYDTPMWRAIKKGIAWGAAAGFATAQFIMQSQTIDTPTGTFYPGNVLLLFGVCVGLGAAMCAGIAYLATRGTDDAVDRSPMRSKKSVD